MYQQITILGNVGSDVDLRHLQDSTPVANFSIATNKSWVGADGQKQQRTTWFRVSAFGKQAEVLADYVKKGSALLVNGEIQQAKPYIDKNGEPAVSIEVRLQTFSFVSSSSGVSPDESGAPQQTQAKGQTNLSEEDIPF